MAGKTGREKTGVTEKGKRTMNDDDRVFYICVALAVFFTAAISVLVALE